MRLTQRLDLIKYTVLIGLFASVLLSINLWAGQRWFPKVPCIENFYGLRAPYDYVNLAVLLLLLILALLSPLKKPVIALLLFCGYLCFDDQNRLQPWFFNYLLILAILLFYKRRVDEPNNYTSVFISLQLLVALIYIFSGIQKLNSHFLNDTFIWMIEPLGNILTPRQMDLLTRFGNVVPYLEAAIGLSFLIKPLRYLALPIVIIMHVVILILLGPLGKSYNYVVWPWNIIMIILDILLFANVKQERFFDISFLFKGIPFYIVITLMLIFPVFSLNNKYDSYLSSSLYSGNTHGCKLILSDRAYEKLPYYIRHFVNRNPNYNILYIKSWAIEELGTPCIPEYRAFKAVQKRIITLTQSTAEEDVKMDFSEREKIIVF